MTMRSTNQNYFPGMRPTTHANLNTARIGRGKGQMGMMMGLGNGAGKAARGGQGGAVGRGRGGPRQAARPGG
jgi:hypothetical protein